MKHETTAKRLKLAIENAGLKPYQLADKSGVSQPSISQYLKGSHKPSNISSGKMAEVLNVSPVWLMGFDVPMRDSSATTDHIKNILSMDAETRDKLFISKAQSNAEFWEHIKILFSLKPEIQKEIYSFIDFKNGQIQQGESYDSQQIV